MYTYNTNQETLKLKEYGRNIQKLISQLETIEDKTIRTKYAQVILKIMNLLHISNNKSITEPTNKRWDDLFIISDYKLNIDNPYPMPNKELRIKPPQKMSYSKKSIKYRHCGRHIELFIKKALETTDVAKQTDMVLSIGKLIKNFSAAWNKDNLDINTTMTIIQDLAGDKLLVDIEKLKSENNFNNSNTVSKEKTRPYKNKRNIFAPNPK